MKKVLFLTSTGLPLETRQYFLDVLEEKPHEMTVAFIPTAADPYEDKWFIDKDIEQLKEIGFKVEVVDLKQPDLKKQLEKADIIHIGGGNTFYLLDWFRKSGLDKHLTELINNGKIYIGSSAGSIIVGPNIELSSWGAEGDKNIVNLKDLTGLKIVPFAIWPHYTGEVIKKTDYQVIPITNEQAVLVQNNDWKVVGVKN